MGNECPDPNAVEKCAVFWALEIPETDFFVDLFSIGKEYEKSTKQKPGFIFEEYVTEKHTVEDVRDLLVKHSNRLGLGAQQTIALRTSIIFFKYVSGHVSRNLDFLQLSKLEPEAGREAEVTIHVFFRKMVTPINIQIWKLDPQSSANNLPSGSHSDSSDKEKRTMTSTQIEKVERFGNFTHATTLDFEFFGENIIALELEVCILWQVASRFFLGQEPNNLELFKSYNGGFKKNRLGNLNDITDDYTSSHIQLFRSVQAGETYVLPEDGNMWIREIDDNFKSNQWGLDHRKKQGKTVEPGERAMVKRGGAHSQPSDTQNVTTNDVFPSKKKRV